MASSADSTVTVPRTSSRQALRVNVEHENVRRYYRRTVFLDCLLQQLNERFQRRTEDVIKGMCLIPSNLCNVDKNVEHIKLYYGNDLPNEDRFIQEIKLWKQNTLSNIGTFNAKKYLSNVF